MTEAEFFKKSFAEQAAYLTAEGEEVEFIPHDGNYERYIYFVPDGKFYVTACIGASNEIVKIEKPEEPKA